LATFAETWNDRPQSEVEADAALTALVRRADLGDLGLRLTLQVPSVIADSHCIANVTEMVVTHFAPMIIGISILASTAHI
jgi:hypothetical protein